MISAQQGQGSDQRQAYRPGYEIAAEQILAYIAGQGLQPGHRLPTEQQLCEILHVSRSVTREAVKVLSALGRITVRKGAGLFVADGLGIGISGGSAVSFQPADMAHVEMLFDFRLTIESEAARRAAECASPPEVKTIREAAERTVAAAQVENFATFRTADEEFHRSIGAASHNMFIAGTVDQITQLKRQVLTIGLRGSASGSLSAAAQQHIDIALAISTGDSASAAAAVGRHIEIARSQFQERIRARLSELVGS